MEDSVVARRPGDAQGGVDGTVGLGIGAGEVDDDLVALDEALDADIEGPVDDAVVLHAVLEGIGAVGKGAELGPHARLGIIHQVVTGAAEGFLAVLLNDLAAARLAQIDGADQRPEIAVVLARRADVGQHDLPHVIHVFTAALDLDRRHAQALVEDLGGLAGKTAGDRAPGFGDVADRHRVAHQLAIDEDRLEEGVLGGVQPAAVGIVVDDHVALFDRVGGNLGDTGFDEERHAADLRRAEIRHRDHLTLGVRRARR